jgi:hypothetical protein
LSGREKEWVVDWFEGTVGETCIENIKYRAAEPMRSETRAS